jgi:hypothetical protein
LQQASLAVTAECGVIKAEPDVHAKLTVFDDGAA